MRTKSVNAYAQCFAVNWHKPAKKAPPQRFMALFPGPPGWVGARRELLGFMMQVKFSTGRHTDHQDGRHSIWTNQCPPPLSPQLRHVPTIGKKNLLNSNTSSTCPHNMANCGPLAAEILSLVWGTPANFSGFRVLAALLHDTLVAGVSQTLRC